MKESNLEYISKFENLDYEQFKQLALDPNLLPHEKVGFPGSYRGGKEPLIWQDIQNKMSNLALAEQIILDIGPGCSELPHFLLDLAKKKKSKVILCDSKEMLSQLPDEQYISKIEGPFPGCRQKLGTYTGKVNTIIVYSVLHYVFGEDNVWHFIECCLELLAEGGQILFGDLPNYSKRTRFFNSIAGKKAHLEYIAKNNTNADPMKNQPPNSIFDDSLILSLVKRIRDKGFNAYILPQPDHLPMGNRREDILVERT